MPQRITIVATYPVEPVTTPGARDVGAPNAVPIAEPAAAPAAVEASPTETPDARIRRLLQRYEDAYRRRDVRTAIALWPSVDQEALTRAFASLDRQDVHFEQLRHRVHRRGGGCAVCVGTVLLCPASARRREGDRITWTFDLARSGRTAHRGLSAR